MARRKHELIFGWGGAQDHAMFETRLQQQDHLVVVHFYEYQRSPAALPEALRLSPIVNAHLHEIGDGATLIAYPEQVVAVANYLQAHGVLWRDGSRLMERGRWDQLRRRHIMFSEDFREAVLASILDRPGTGANNGRGKQNIRVRRKKWVGIHMSWASRAGDFMPGLGYWASGRHQFVVRDNCCGAGPREFGLSPGPLSIYLKCGPHWQVPN